MEYSSESSENASNGDYECDHSSSSDDSSVHSALTSIYSEDQDKNMMLEKEKRSNIGSTFKMQK